MMLRRVAEWTPRARAMAARPSALGARWMGSTTGSGSAASGAPERQTVEIGGVVAPVKDAKAIGLVPRGYLPPFSGSRAMSQELLGHLRWMLQKDLLSQDMFLIGPPGASRRLLSMRFCELLNKEVEYVAISPDTTESDLKQRREIVDGAVIFTDQAPVRAAINGRVLVIDGLEKAERNVLPTLNNLLENREMSLDDGRFLMKAESYDALLSTGYSRRDLDAQKLVRVHPDFRVIALGLPVPPYPGRTLDPPLRSRFQARNIRPPSPGTQLEALVTIAPSVPIPVLERLVGIREAVNVIEATTQSTGSSGQQRMPHFDYLSMAHCAQLLDKFPNASISSTVRRVFPVTTEVFGVKAASSCSTLDRVLNKFASDLSNSETRYTIERVTKHSPSDFVATATFRATSPEGSDGTVKELQLPCGASTPQNGPMRGFYETAKLRSILSDMIQDHAAGGDLCVLGAKGSGKSDLARLFAHRLGYPTELFSLFKDMTARDLLQRRATDSWGNTRWEDSPLIHAARRGHIAILDGVHRLGSDSLGVLQRLIQDREIDLADGTKLLSQAKYDAVVRQADGDAGVVEGSSALSTSRIVPIHPSFRIIAIAETDPYSLKSTAAVPGKEPTSAWLNSESIAMFSFHHLPKLSRRECEEIVGHLYPDLPAKTSRALLSFADKLRDAKERSNEPDYLSLTLSLRQLLRVCRRLNAYPSQSLDDLRLVLHDTLLTQFLPSSCARLVDSLLDESGVPAERKANAATAIDSVKAEEIRQENDRLFIGDISYPLQRPSNPELVPQPHFFDIPKHTATMKDMLQDVASGQKHLLLIGNQGVGKNKVVDRLLQLLQQEREYIQLHRDTTIQTLTLVPTLVDGKIVWEDSPLVRAAKTGRTLVVDEADKAPLEVVCVLKGLIEDGEMLLGNGKRLVDPTKVALEDYEKDQVIPLHPNFQMWVLANRPGFPFLGNNFFREIGDIFASHAIDNPDEESELELLRAYAPTVPTEILRRLCRAFAELRELVEQGVITYPYSTREAVAVAKHLEKFPGDGITSVLENVLAFDAYDPNMRQQLSEVFLSHGIPLSASGEDFRVAITLATPKTLPPTRDTEKWRWDADSTVRLSFDGKKKGRKKQGSASHLFRAELKRRQIWLDPPTKRSFAVQQHRLQHFTEQLASFRVPLTASREQAAHALAVFPDDTVHVLTRSPMSLHCFSNAESGDGRTHQVLELESQYMRWETNPVLVNLAHQQELAVFIPSTGKPLFRLAAAGLTIFVNPEQNADGRARCFALPDGALDGQVHQETGNATKAHPFAKWFGGGGDSPSSSWRVVVNDSRDEGLLVRFQHGGSIFQLVDFRSNSFYSMDLGSQNVFGKANSTPLEQLTDIQQLGNGEWLLRTTDESVVYSLQRVDESEFVLKRGTVERSSADTRTSLFAGQSFGVHRDAFLQEISSDDGHVESALREPVEARDGMLRAWSNDEHVVNTSVSSDESVVDLELTSPRDQSTRTVVVDARRADATTATASELSPMPRVVGVAQLHSNGQHTVTLHEDGNVRIWQFDQAALDRELKLWKQLVGFSDPDGHHNRSGALELKLNGQSPESTPRTGLDAPKYGKEDPKNDPHVGGNTWAGGSGGSDTAGLGGRGGPYRLDKGHPIHQVSQEKKDEVSAATRANARAMAEEALAARLEEIDMSDQEWATYQRYIDRVEPEIAQLRAILGNLESVEQERSWLKHQSSGELDDAKLVDGVVGERLVFKRRGQSDSPFAGRAQSHLPKRLLFVMDVSGSMYRFNGQDGRLERMLETSLMVMESFAGFDKTLEYSIVGHSGDSPDIPFVAFGEPPADRKQRLKVLQKMAAHAQYCSSGDYTVEAVARAVKRVAEQYADDYYVLVVSDANLDRYGIRPARIGELLAADPRVKAHAIFIASLADEAERIKRQLPAGRGHVCLDTADLPRTFQQIFSAAFRG